MLWNDDSVAGDTEKMAGLKTMMPSGAALADNKRRTPSATYATLKTDFGSVGGGTTEADDNYVVWSPTIVDYTGTGFSGPPTFEDRCLDALDLGFQYTRARQTKGGNKVNTVFAHPSDYTKIIQKIRSLDQALITRDKSQSTLIDMGFDAIVYESSEISMTQSATETELLGVQITDAIMWSIMSELYTISKDEHLETQSFRWVVCHRGNVIFQRPSNYFFLNDIT